jgi:hypothetical protein
MDKDRLKGAGEQATVGLSSAILTRRLTPRIVVGIADQNDPMLFRRREPRRE